jgi:peptidoglycan hydrolase-like protein with peptidoglycan-binding domain
MARKAAAAPDAPPSDAVRPMAPTHHFLKLGTEHDAVATWRDFLRGQGFAVPEAPARLFDIDAVQATRDFQAREGLEIDGRVGDESWKRARRLATGLKPPPAAADDRLPDPGNPPRVPFLGAARRAALYTMPRDWEAVGRDTDDVRFADDWEARNIVRVVVPQLAGIRGAPNDGGVRFHRLATTRLQKLFAAWEAAGLLARVLTFEGAFNARMIRGKPDPKAKPPPTARQPKPLSNHAFGLAFDINARWNGLGEPPARPGETGCLYELVPIAWDHGFYWGGNFAKRPDGMHFEVGDVPVA